MYLLSATSKILVLSVVDSVEAIGPLPRAYLFVWCIHPSLGLVLATNSAQLCSSLEKCLDEWEPRPLGGHYILL